MTQVIFPADTNVELFSAPHMCEIAHCPDSLNFLVLFDSITPQSADAPATKKKQKKHKEETLLQQWFAAEGRASSEYKAFVETPAGKEMLSFEAFVCQKCNLTKRVS